jgi:putative ABC transport system substrate-binding protein
MAKKAKAKSNKATKFAGKRLAKKRIGIVHSGRNGPHSMDNINVITDALEAAGYDNSNVDIAPLFAGGSLSQIQQHVRTHMTNRVRILIAAGGSACAKTANDENIQIPIVFTSVADPAIAIPAPGVKRNMTGVCARTAELDIERVKLLLELNPAYRLIGALTNPDRPNAPQQWQKLVADVQALGVQGLALHQEDVLAQNRSEGQIKQAIKDAFDNFVTAKVEAVLVTANPLFNDFRSEVVDAAKSKSLPTIYQWSEFAKEGGLMSFGPSLKEAYLGAAQQVSRILPQIGSGLEIQYPPVFSLETLELVINVTTANNIPNLKVPQSLLDRAQLVTGPAASKGSKR